METRFLILAFACVNLVTLLQVIIIYANPVDKILLPKSVKDMMLNKTLQTIRNDVIPNLPTTLRINDTTFNVDSENAKGTLALSNAVATGLNSLVDDINVNLASSKAEATLKIPSKTIIKGEYNLDGTVNPGEDESTTVSGNGQFTITVTNLNVAMDAKLDIGILSGKVAITKLDIQVGYDSIAINADNFAVNDENVDWELVNTELNDNFESIWSQYQEPLIIAITEGVNELLSETTLSDLLDVFQGTKTFDQLFKTEEKKRI